MKYYETSAKADIGINELMASLMEQVYHNMYANGNQMDRGMQSVALHQHSHREAKDHGASRERPDCNC